MGGGDGAVDMSGDFPPGGLSLVISLVPEICHPSLVVDDGLVATESDDCI
jgi:hypothetical protein